MAEITIRVSDKAVRITGIVVGGIVLASVFFYLWASGVFVPKYRLRVYVPELSGLRVRTQVELDGVQVGSVTAIKVAGESASPERRIELDLRVDKRYQDAIRSDSVATAVSEGLLGDRYLNILRGFKGSVISSDGEVQFLPTQEISFKDVLRSVEKMVDCPQAEKSSTEDKTQAPQETPAKSDH
ncbi:MAG: MlaD family protein [Candidatus Acidiferrales bacterium]